MIFFHSVIYFNDERRLMYLTAVFRTILRLKYLISHVVSDNQ